MAAHDLIARKIARDPIVVRYHTPRDRDINSGFNSEAYGARPIPGEGGGASWRLFIVTNLLFDLIFFLLKLVFFVLCNVPIVRFCITLLLFAHVCIFVLELPSLTV
jgi:hypothetical protein